MEALSEVSVSSFMCRSSLHVGFVAQYVGMFVTDFFYSGIDSSFKIEERITRLGGKVVQQSSLTVESARRKTFFLADYNCWRKMKYILANSLGTPMLHFQWIAELEQKYHEVGTAKPFDSELYKKYRLPLGLDVSRGIYPLQRASNARTWDPPGHIKGEGEKIFHGMTIALALAIEDTQAIEWYVQLLIRICSFVDGFISYLISF